MLFCQSSSNASLTGLYQITFVADTALNSAKSIHQKHPNLYCPVEKRLISIPNPVNAIGASPEGLLEMIDIETVGPVTSHSVRYDRCIACFPKKSHAENLGFDFQISFEYIVNHNLKKLVILAVKIWRF